MNMEKLKTSILLAFVLVDVGSAQDSAQQQKPSCDKPYRLGHFVAVATEDLRLDRSRAITKKETKDWEKKQDEAQRQCAALVRQHPNLAVSEMFSFTVKGFATIHERCESFCGTDDELMQLYESDVKASSPHQSVKSQR
jgi:hypothetical protein